MQFSFPKIPIDRIWQSLSLARVLGIAWWGLLVFLFAGLLFDAFLFYLYGLGYAKTAPSLSGQSPIVIVETESIREAAKRIQDMQIQFASSTPTALHQGVDAFR